MKLDAPQVKYELKLDDTIKEHRVLTQIIGFTSIDGKNLPVIMTNVYDSDWYGRVNGQNKILLTKRYYSFSDATKGHEEIVNDIRQNHEKYFFMDRSRRDGAPMPMPLGKDYQFSHFCGH